MGADILVTDQQCTKAWSVQVKTNGKKGTFWLLNRKVKETVSPTHIYALVNIRQDGEPIEYFIVPSAVVARLSVHKIRKASEWWGIDRKEITDYKDRWDLFS